MDPKLVEAHNKAIQILEMLAHTMQGMLTVVANGPVRDKAIMRLAQVDQNLAKRKDRLGILGRGTCAYLNE